LSGAEGGGIKPPSKSDIEKILKRDDFGCRFCGFRAVQYQRVVPIAEGLVTACIFCEQVASLERTALIGGGVLVWLPEITQVELNHIIRAIYVARASEGSDVATLATRALDALMLRRAEAKKRLGSDDPFVLATVLQENLTNGEYAAALPKLEGIRLLALDKHMVHGRFGDFDGFPQIVQFWRSSQGPFSALPVDEWKSMLTKVAA
jgi:hypothetical protein